MQIKFLGGVQEVGKSATLVDTDIKLLLDYGMKIRRSEEDSRFPASFGEYVDLVAVGHCHIDHSGFLPSVFDKCSPRVIGTPPTKELTALLLEDSMKLMEEIPYRVTSYKQLMRNFFTIEYNQPFHSGRTTIKLLDAGHITGSAMIDIRYERKRLLYNPDFNTIDTMLHKGAEAPKEEYTALITESTYSNREHPDRKKTEQEFYNEIKKTYENGGNALVPAFAVDRTQEVISIIRKFDKDIPIYMDGMSKDATDIMFSHRRHVRDFKRFRKDMDSVERIYNHRQRRTVLDEPCVIVSTAGMLTGGPAMYYINHLNSDSHVLFTGYCAEETNGNLLLNKGYIKVEGREVQIDLPAKYYDFSAHAGKKELIQFVKDVNPERIFCVHGDDCNGFADLLKKEGFDAIAPRLNESFRI